MVAQVGAETLRAGGNAFDAAVAMGFASAVVEPAAAGIGGGKLQYVFVTRGGRAGCIDAPVVCPSGALPGSYEIDPTVPRGLFGFRGVKNRENEEGHRSVAVPGVLAGLCFALRRFGSLPLPLVVEPAVELARNGFKLSWIDICHIASSQALIARYPETSAIFLRNGQVPSPSVQFPLGEDPLLLQRDLAASLAGIGQQGPDLFYRGDIAQAIVDEMARGGGWLTREDLRSYQPRECPVSVMEYRGFKLMTGPDFEIFEGLGILSNFDLASMGHNSVEELNLVAQASFLAHGDFYGYLTSPDGKVPPLDKYTAPGFLRDRASLMDPSRASFPALFPEEGASPMLGGNTTTGYAAKDRWGNVVTCLQTHGSVFGSGVTVPGTGILLNDQMLGFNPESGTHVSIAPRKSRPIPGWPIIGVGKDGRVFALYGPGGNRVACALIQAVINIVDYGLPIREALLSPRIDCGSVPGARNVILADSQLPRAVVEGLEAMGHRTMMVSRSFVAPGGSPHAFASPGGIADADDGVGLSGANDPDVDGGLIELSLPG